MAETTKVSDAPVAPVFGSVARGEIVTIAIGPERKLYHIHKELIRHHSEYFRTAYNGRWIESDEEVALDEVEVEVFNLFVHWLYAQDLPRHMRSILRIAEVNVSRADPAFAENWSSLLLKSSAFGDRFLAKGFQCLIHNIFVDYHFGKDRAIFCGYEDIIWAFENLAADNPLLNLVVDLQCLRWKETFDEEEEKKLLRPHLPHSFLLRVMLKQGTLSGQDRAKVEINPCSYHLHATPEEKETCVWQPVRNQWER